MRHPPENSSRTRAHNWRKAPSRFTSWNVNQIPNLWDKVVIITGATSGIGRALTEFLAGKRAQVIMAARNLEKAHHVAAEIRQTLPDARLDIRELELSSMDSIHRFAHGFLADYTQLHLLINNAGVMACPYEQTEDGVEIQMATNHLGHFALSGLMLPLLRSTRDSRVVNTSSIGHRMGKIDFSDFHWERRSYHSTQAYADSKLANLYFTYEFARRVSGEGSRKGVGAEAGAGSRAGTGPGAGAGLRAGTGSSTPAGLRAGTGSSTPAGIGIPAGIGPVTTTGTGPGAPIVVAAHPGWTRTGLQKHVWYLQKLNPWLSQSPAEGALPTLRAAFDPMAKPGDYFGPSRFFEMHGSPVLVSSSRRSHDRDAAKKLWAISEEITNVKYLHQPIPQKITQHNST